jgi:hypothetical protein
MPDMASTPRSRPCDVREALAPWKRDHLYLGDSGEVLCGGCMGIESTYTPWAWSDLGAMGPDRSVTVELTKLADGAATKEHWTVRCELDTQTNEAR